MFNSGEIGNRRIVTPEEYIEGWADFLSTGQVITIQGDWVHFHDPLKVTQWNVITQEQQYS